LQNEIVVGFINVGGWSPSARTVGVGWPSMQGILEEAIHLILKNGHVAKWIPTDQIHGFHPFIRSLLEAF